MGKQITDAQLLAQRGVNLVERRLLEMGLAWNPTTPATDAGIDGYVELRDPETGAMSANVLLVQSKARTVLAAETDTSFEFTPSTADLNYWLQSRGPLLLIISRPASNEAWWMEIRSHVQRQSHTSKAIRFDKTQDRFDIAAGPRLLQLGRDFRPGVYFSPPRIRESLVTNLVQIKSLPGEIYMADTTYRHPGDLAGALRQCRDRAPSEWTLEDKRIYSVHDLREGCWPEFCDRGTVERIETDEWAQSEVPETRARFAKILDRCFAKFVEPFGIKYRRSMRCYYFAASPDLSNKVINYRSLRNLTERDVFVKLHNKIDKTRHYFRHSAFESRFRAIEGRWHVELNPLYVFTTDGVLEHPRQAERQSALRRLEGHAAVFGQVLMLSRLLEDRSDLLGGRYPFLSFAGLAKAEVDCGILDDIWNSDGWNSGMSDEERSEEDGADSDDNGGSRSLFEQ